MSIVTVGIDLAKNAFTLHGIGQGAKGAHGIEGLAMPD